MLTFGGGKGVGPAGVVQAVTGKGGGDGVVNPQGFVWEDPIKAGEIVITWAIIEVRDQAAHFPSDRSSSSQSMPTRSLSRVVVALSAQRTTGAAGSVVSEIIHEEAAGAAGKGLGGERGRIAGDRERPDFRAEAVPANHLERVIGNDRLVEFVRDEAGSSPTIWLDAGQEDALEAAVLEKRSSQDKGMVCSLIGEAG